MTPERGPTHAELLQQINEIRKDVKDNERERDEFRVESNRLMNDVFRQIKEIGHSLDGLKASAAKTEAAVLNVVQSLGEEPTTDGAGGRGLIGSVRKTERDLQSLLDLRRMGLGAVGAVTLFSVLIIAGAVAWIKGLFPAAVPP